jgi:excisionase family DNA binding protein
VPEFLGVVSVSVKVVPSGDIPMRFENLGSASESEIALLLGVSRRMVRKYFTKRKLPFVGKGSNRRFSWPEVLEWYLLYRVEIFAKGGQQRSTLRLKIREILEKAIYAAEANSTVRFEKRERTNAIRNEAIIKKLKGATLQGLPHRRLRMGRRQTKWTRKE